MGNLVYQYSPFQNLQNINPDLNENKSALLGLSINSENAEIDIINPITIETEVSYDDSINLIISDNVNPPKIINSRFYQTSTMTYEVADRKGNLDTNIYSEQNFKVETSLIKSIRTITTVDFLGIKDGGNMKIGNYTFYFKLADADGNESDFVAESGKVVCHVGSVNTPKSIRGGQQDENSYKVIKFRLNNLDLAYDYINIYYTRSTGDGDSSIIKTYKIEDKFKITNNDVEISITGYENHNEISLDDINIQYTTFDSVKTLANCQNITFAGNITNDYNLFKTLEKYSLYITPEVVYDDDGIGNLNYKYNENFIDVGYEYYNANNIYYKLGYWDEEIYRFGIVYILNNYTLSPVFNTRGRKLIGNSETFTDFKLTDNINYGEDYIIENSRLINNPENVKGVFKIDCESKLILKNSESIKPIGLKFNFTNNVIVGISNFIPGLQDITKGFFIVRQKRVPTILAQAIGIGTSKKGYVPVIKGIKRDPVINYNYFGESFLKVDSGLNDLILQPSFFTINDNLVNNNALLCPEACLRRAMFNTFFNSSEYLLRRFKYYNPSGVFNNYDNNTNNFSIKNFKTVNDSELANSIPISTELTLVEPGIDLIVNGDPIDIFVEYRNYNKFSSKAGDAIIPYKYRDLWFGDYENPSNTIPPRNETPSDTNYNLSYSKVRGEFNTYVACNTNNIVHGTYYNIFQKDYNFDDWKNYFLIRYNDSSPFFPIGDRTSWDSLTLKETTVYGTTYSSEKLFRGDCYINTYTHRMNWNFIDPDMPTNKKIVDIYSWAKNFKIKRKVSTVVRDVTEGVPVGETLAYNKLLLLFTYKNVFEPSWENDVSAGSSEADFFGLIESDEKKFKKYSEINGLFGAEKLNRPDVNAVPLGYWVTFKICSNINLAMRDLDWTKPEEESIHRIKRGFYPLQAMDPHNHLPESDIINNGISKSLGDKYYYEIPDVPFIKTNFATRIYYSNLLQSSTFANGNRVFEASNYQDYTREYGALVKLVEWYGKLIAVMEHGVIMIPVNERAMMKNESGEDIYINTSTILPKNPTVLSNTFGSLWPESIIKTARYIYGIDTVGKKIWRTNGEEFENVSDMKVQKFLNDHIKLLESDKDRTIGVNFIKSHYNAFKHDVLFVFKYNDVAWNLCWNELTQKWVTQYTWFPEFSENINNIFYTFANQLEHTSAENKLYKHGFAGTQEELGNIKPTKWYDEQHPFEYEFVVGDIPGVQKIYNNLKIISNLAEPDSFYYEVVGEGFDWYPYKELIMKLNDTSIARIGSVSLTVVSNETKVEDDVKLRYKEYLIAVPTLKKLPYIYVQSFDVNDNNSFLRDRGTLTAPFNMSETRDITLREHNKTKERLVNSYQKGVNIKQFGRMRGNMQYLEDAWDIQIQPISFQYAYIVPGEPGEQQEPTWDLLFTSKVEMRIRDKYIKVRVKYSGTQYAIINAIRTLFTISFA